MATIAGTMFVDARMCIMKPVLGSLVGNVGDGLVFLPKPLH